MRLFNYSLVNAIPSFTVKKYLLLKRLSILPRGRIFLMFGY